MKFTPLPDASAAEPDARVVSTWNTTTAFPGTANPNGVWEYGYAATTDGAVVMLSSILDDPAGTFWVDPANSIGKTPSIWRNDTTDVVTGVPPGSLSMHPGQNGEITLLRFTAPEAATYEATIQIFHGDTGITEGTVYVNHGLVFSRTIETDDPTVTVPGTKLEPGNTIDVWIGPAGDGNYDNTPVTFEVRTAP